MVHIAEPISLLESLMLSVERKAQPTPRCSAASVRMLAHSYKKELLPLTLSDSYIALSGPTYKTYFNS